MYSRYIKRRYLNPTIVFDGYHGQSTKDVAHLRRTHGIVGPTIEFTDTMPLKIKKERFLANSTNKQQFINNLVNVLIDEVCTVVHCESDADLHIVKAAVSSAIKKETVLIGEDTDLLVLLLYHVDRMSKRVILT